MLPNQTIGALLDELSSIEKVGGLKDALKNIPSVVRKVPAALKRKVDEVALKAHVKANGSRIGRVVVNHVLDPNNTVDLANGVGGISKMFGG